jgi:nickel-dependent lactate racemase
MLLFARGSENDRLSNQDMKEGLFEALDKLGERKNVLAIPPDYTRFHSHAGILTEFAWQYYGENMTSVLPAVGTHSAMTEEQIGSMFGAVPKSLFKEHKFREDITTLGKVPKEFIKEISEGKIEYDWPAQVNKILTEANRELILSIGQVVPHEVVGMANYNKNIFVGTGGSEGINKSHYLGAVYGMERYMGRTESPVRKVLDYASDNFSNHLPIVYVQTVVGRDEAGGLAVRGLFIGDDIECFYKAAELALKVNFTMLDSTMDKVVVYLDPDEFKSTWLGNKSIYRTRMAIADEGELIVLGPGVKEFGEDPEIDKLIRKYGYFTTEKILENVEANDDLRANLSAAAHLIHGSSEDRFKITYCPGALTQEEIESVNFGYSDLDTMIKKYDPKKLNDGWNDMPDGERIYYISNPAIGLWAYEGRFNG